MLMVLFIFADNKSNQMITKPEVQGFTSDHVQNKIYNENEWNWAGTQTKCLLLPIQCGPL